MKHLKTYNESIRDKMTPKPDHIIDEKIEKIFNYLVDKTIKDKYTEEKKDSQWYWDYKYDEIVELAMEGWSKEEIYREYGSDLEDYFDDEDDYHDEYDTYYQPF